MNVPNSDTVNTTSENHQLQRNVATKIKSFETFPPEINVIPKTKCSVVGMILVRNINADCTAASIQ
jgi:hypothetical protein